MSTTRIKFCGITSVADARAAAQAGADAIGLVFYPPSPRAVDLQLARQIARAVPAFISLTGLFVNPSRARVEEVLEQVPLDLLQFHGDEDAGFCAGFGRRWIKAVQARRQADIETAFASYHDSSGLLIDAWDPDLYGGTGATFNWELIPAERPLPVILAGGLNSANVAGAIRQVRPWAVDVSGGIEKLDDRKSVIKGVKDPARMHEFLREVQRVNQTD